MKIAAEKIHRTDLGTGVGEAAKPSKNSEGGFVDSLAHVLNRVLDAALVKPPPAGAAGIPNEPNENQNAEGNTPTAGEPQDARTNGLFGVAASNAQSAPGSVVAAIRAAVASAVHSKAATLEPTEQVAQDTAALGEQVTVSAAPLESGELLTTAAALSAPLPVATQPNPIPAAAAAPPAKRPEPALEEAANLAPGRFVSTAHPGAAARTSDIMEGRTSTAEDQGARSDQHERTAGEGDSRRDPELEQNDRSRARAVANPVTRAEAQTSTAAPHRRVHRSEDAEPSGQAQPAEATSTAASRPAVQAAPVETAQPRATTPPPVSATAAVVASYFASVDEAPIATPAAAVQAAAPPPRVPGVVELPETAVMKAVTAAQNGGGNATVELQHPKLGPIVIQITVSREGLVVNAIASNPAAVAALRSGEAGLRTAVSKHGIELRGLRVELNHSQSKGHGGRRKGSLDVDMEA